MTDRRPPPPLWQHQRILIVEDHPFQLVALEVLLNSLGLYNLRPSLDGNEAQEIAETTERPFDLLLCDLDLPDMSGIELISRLHERGLIKDVILFSALFNTLEPEQLRSLLKDIQQCGLPISCCLSKPLTSASLLPELEQRIPHSRK
ncbi:MULTISPECIES: response regulator [Pseudomonas]|uniref:response regulator n=1 Tax=Pseudomonas TaxID=286 RepID=UPI0021483F47|nr:MULTISPECIES: response regulator [Pseudomonas]UUT23022.1 response regulator [Pseudomonas sp. T8]WJV26354.1 response regulator [Pseudomonas chlororaphis]